MKLEVDIDIDIERAVVEFTKESYRAGEASASDLARVSALIHILAWKSFDFDNDCAKTVVMAIQQNHRLLGAVIDEMIDQGLVMAMGGLK